MGSEKVLENFSQWSWKVLKKSWIFFSSERVGTLVTNTYVRILEIKTRHFKIR